MEGEVEGPGEFGRVDELFEERIEEYVVRVREKDDG